MSEVLLSIFPLPEGLGAYARVTSISLEQFYVVELAPITLQRHEVEHCLKDTSFAQLGPAIMALLDNGESFQLQTVSADARHLGLEEAEEEQNSRTLIHKT